MSSPAIGQRIQTTQSKANLGGPVHLLRSAAGYSTIVLLVFGPLAFGAVEPWALVILHIGSVVAFFLWFAYLWTLGTAFELRAIHVPPVLFAAIVLGQILFNGSAYRHQTVSEFLNFVAYGLIFLVSSDLFRNEREARILCICLAGLGFLLATLGSVQEFTSSSKLYWLRTPRSGGPIFGPYVNRNHYAGAMELMFPFAFFGSLKPTLEGSKRVMLSFAALLMIATVFLCGSRGGLFAIALQAVFATVLVFWRSKRLALAAALALCFIVSAAFGTWLGSERVLGRLADIGNESGRIQMTRDSLRMFSEHPIGGWGLGTFPVIYPKYRSFVTNFYVNEAHNDFVQLLVETGIGGLAAGLLLLFLVFQRWLRELQNRPLWSWRTIAVGASITGVIGLAVHSMFDFNLHIPANALLFYVLCATAGSDDGFNTEVIHRLGCDRDSLCHRGMKAG